MPLFINLDQTKEAILLFQQIPWVLLYSAGVVHWFLYQQPQHSSTHDCWQSHLHKANNQEIRILLIKCYKKRFHRGTSICIAYLILWNYSHIIKNDSLVLVNIAEHDNSFFYYIKLEIISLLSWNWPSSKQFLPDLISINKNTCSSTITADRTSNMNLGMDVETRILVQMSP